MAFLARAYVEKIATLEQEDKVIRRGGARSHSRGGKGKLRTEAKQALLPLIFPNPTPKDRGTFNKRLHRAIRWYDAAEKLGWGSLCLIPHDQVTNSWVEQTLRVGEWSIWLELVKKVNPDAYNASKAFDTWLGSDNIASGSIDGKEPLLIEAEVTEVAEVVEEVHDNEGDGDMNEEDNFTSTPSQVSVELTTRWRQRTLLELFEPYQHTR